MTPGYQLPLSQDEFRKALKLGLGRAFRTVELHGLELYRDAFLAGCLESQVFDQECEAGRWEWLSRFFSGAPDWLSSPLYLKMCQLDPELEHSRQQWCKLCLLLAQRGSTEAREALYRGFRVLDSGDLVAAEEIVELDGDEGLVWVAEHLDKAAHVDRSTFLNLLWVYDDGRSEGDGLKLLRSRNSPRLKGFLRRVDRPEPGWTRPTHPSTDSLTVRELAESLSMYELSRWATGKPPDKLRDLAQILRTHRDPDVLEKILFCFRVGGLPEFDPVLLQLAEYSYGDTARRARWVMAYHDHPSVREKALQWLGQGLVEKGRLRALRRSFQMSDLQAVTEAVVNALQRLNEHQAHDLLGDVIFLAEHHLNAEVSSLLHLVYQHTPCTNCRRDVVSYLFRDGLLPDWMREECRFDCDEEIRELVSTGGQVPSTAQEK